MVDTVSVAPESELLMLDAGRSGLRIASAALAVTSDQGQTGRLGGVAAGPCSHGRCAVVVGEGAVPSSDGQMRALPVRLPRACRLVNLFSTDPA